ncbi:MAG: DUF1573 domain-containing protein [Bacteroidetes bacterium]|jgi:hypothetical protein|nr:DUF1573 domain-containing protein [Bacteroidota bacterium]MBT6687104.1 DUF1573 domain-containing protein [Bacteroidota bacterium]MBT7144481.1 DUF1573 domain-containing protein [Bacteroidota bacterium]MBT7490806.1 DUF1573 domain-containing protein [Bacteroidota bacterium]
MKKLLLVVFTFLFVSTVGFAQKEISEKKENKRAPEITFDETTHDYGLLKHKGNGVYEFKFENTGKEPLILTNVKSSCGCTVPTWPKDPIKKGKDGVISVKYDTRRQGRFQKTITVYSNAKNSPIRLVIKGEVERATQKPTTNRAKPNSVERPKRIPAK